MPTQLSQLKLTLALSCAPRCYSYVYRSSAVDRACFVLKKAERSLNLEGYLEGYQRTAPPRPEGKLIPIANASDLICNLMGKWAIFSTFRFTFLSIGGDRMHNTYFFGRPGPCLIA